MSTDRIELLDRQYQRLTNRDGAAFIRELRAFHDFITTTSPFDGILAELTAEAEQTIAQHAAHDEALIPEAIELRNELAQRAPESDDSARARPDEHGPDDLRWQFSFANFDLVAADDDHGQIIRDEDRTRSGMLLRILRNRVETLNWYEDPEAPQPIRAETPIRPDLDDFAVRLRNIEERHRHAVQAYLQAENRHGGFQMVAVNLVIKEMNPAATVIEEDIDQHAYLNDLFLRVVSGMYIVEKAATPGQTLSSDDEARLQLVIERLRPAVEQVYEDLRLRAATRAASGTPGWLQTGLVALGLLANVVAIVLAPAWFAGLSIATVATAAGLHRRLWPWPPRLLAVACLIVAAVAGAAAGEAIDGAFSGDDTPDPSAARSPILTSTATDPPPANVGGQLMSGNIFRVRGSSARRFTTISESAPGSNADFRLQLANAGPETIPDVAVEVDLPRAAASRLSVSATATYSGNPGRASDDATLRVTGGPACLTYVPGSAALLDAQLGLIRKLPDKITDRPVPIGAVDVPLDAQRIVQFRAVVLDVVTDGTCPR